MLISDWSSDVCSSDLFLQVLRTQGFELIGECRLAGVGKTFMELKLDSMRILDWRTIPEDRAIVFVHQSRVFIRYLLHVRPSSPPPVWFHFLFGKRYTQILIPIGLMSIGFQSTGLGNKIGRAHV